MDGSGQLDFREFMIGVWNWNTYDATGITKLAFNTMDAVDQKGSIDLHEAPTPCCAWSTLVARRILYC